MIYFDNSIDEIIEAVYLSERLTDKIGNPKCNIYINPENIKYLVGKIIIINKNNYDIDKLNQLESNGCRIITRCWYSDKFEYEPYILRINSDINWNGMSIDNSSCLEIGENCNVIVNNLDSSVRLYFPKLENIKNSELVDLKNNLTSLGWALQQVGVNVVNSVNFNDLDLIKTNKTLIRP